MEPSIADEGADYFLKRDATKVEKLRWAREHEAPLVVRLHELVVREAKEADDTHSRLLRQYLDERRTGMTPKRDSLLCKKIRAGFISLEALKDCVKAKPLPVEQWIDLTSMKGLYNRTLTKPEVALLLSVAYEPLALLNRV
jgi:hypothetical protein